MAIKKISSSVDFISQEHEVLEFWENKNIFNKRRNLNKGNEKWSFIDGPITANNPMGVHHAWGRTLKDIYNRYKSLAMSSDIRMVLIVKVSGLKLRSKKSWGSNRKKMLKNLVLKNL